MLTLHQIRIAGWLGIAAGLLTSRLWLAVLGGVAVVYTYMGNVQAVARSAGDTSVATGGFGLTPEAGGSGISPALGLGVPAGGGGCGCGS